MQIKKEKLIIARKKIELCYDFTIELLNKIHKTYPGDDCMEPVDKKNHFNWAFNWIVQQYLLENIDFSDNDELREYFYEYFLVDFYENKNKDFTLMKNYWDHLFSHKIINNNGSEINILLEIFNIFNLSIENKKSIAYIE